MLSELVNSYLTDTINHASIQLKIATFPFELNLKNSILCNGGICVGWRDYFFILSK